MTIHTVDDLPNRWTGRTIPFGGDGDNKTIEEILDNKDIIVIDGIKYKRMRQT